MYFTESLLRKAMQVIELKNRHCTYHKTHAQFSQPKKRNNSNFQKENEIYSTDLYYKYRLPILTYKRMVVVK